ncbi:polysaccharide deacetylase family protein [Candidatus Solirubrobacter pratensis]|uniref:polysaccharide deacetylase family protein n=1 Tax=Candidatus Solirubrobacter pratensis TaxID=1298857 RepID=UPI0009DB934E|nr:polysaccharide deacetylase family protein [Candidatus Solirubrobacter pratensis]
MHARRLHTREALLERRRAHRRRSRRMRRLSGLAAVAATAGIAFGALHRDTPASAAASAPPGVLAPRPSIFPQRDRVAELPYVAVGGRRGREIALTFDDGPGPYTPAILRELHRLQAPATFFQVGATEHYFTDAEAAELRDPLFVIGDHTQRHRRLDRLSPAEQRAEIDEQAAVLRAAGVPQPTLFRPPYGAYDAATLALLGERHMTMVMWSVDSEDYLRPGVDRIVANVLGAAKPGAIVLLHDAGGDRGQTLEALPRIVVGLRERGYRLVSVPRLLKDAPPPLTQPVMGIGAG